MRRTRSVESRVPSTMSSVDLGNNMPVCCVVVQHGATPLVHAAQKGHPDVVLELLEAGANPHTVAQGRDVTNTHTEMSAREWALHKDQHDVVQVLDTWVQKHGEL